MSTSAPWVPAMREALDEARAALATDDVPIGAVGSRWDVVRDRRLNHRPEVLTGVLAEESSALLVEFFAGHRSTR